MTATTDESHAAPGGEDPPRKGRERGRLLSSVRPTVFWPALVVVLVVVVVGVAAPDWTDRTLGSAMDFVVETFGWYYALAVAAFTGFSLWMAFSRFGDIKLGKDEDKAEFSLPAWFSMLFAAGMGIGLVFWGAAEPLQFYTEPKPGSVAGGAGGSSTDRAEAAMSQVFLHWGFHAWAIYVVIGLGLAYAIHRKGRPISIRWALEPLLGERRVRGWMGDVVDVLAIVGTVVGVATSLGLGVGQISAGLVKLNVIDEVTDPITVGLIIGITCLAIASVVSGVGKGIKWLSNGNLVLAGVFLLVMLLLGPTLFLMRDFVESIGHYIVSAPSLTFDTTAYEANEGTGWQGGWTMFYWGWWMSWAPFVGVFIARISKGRSVREFVAGVLLVPTSVTFLWFSVLGGSAIITQRDAEQANEASGAKLGDSNFDPGLLTVSNDGGSATASVQEDYTLLDVVHDLPLAGVLSAVVVLLVMIFFVTSSDSGSLVVDMLASGGDPDPPTWSRVLWASMEGLVAAALILAGGLQALQTGAILTALPFSIILVAIMIATYKALKSEYDILRRAENRVRREQLALEVQDELTDNFDQHFGEPVERKVVAVVDELRSDDNPD